MIPAAAEWLGKFTEHFHRENFGDLSPRVETWVDYSNLQMRVHVYRGENRYTIGRRYMVVYEAWIDPQVEAAEVAQELRAALFPG